MPDDDVDVRFFRLDNEWGDESYHVVYIGGDVVLVTLDPVPKVDKETVLNRLELGGCRVVRMERHRRKATMWISIGGDEYSQIPADVARSMIHESGDYYHTVCLATAHVMHDLWPDSWMADIAEDAERLLGLQSYECTVDLD